MTPNSDIPIEFKGRHAAITDRMQQHAVKKLSSLARFSDRVTAIEVIADHAHEDPEVELIVHVRRGKPLVAKHAAESFSSAIDLLVEKMERQLLKLKERKKDHKIPGGKRTLPKGKVGGPDEETYEDVVRRTLRG